MRLLVLLALFLAAPSYAASFILLVGDSGSLTGADNAIEAVVEAHGHTATVMDDGAAENLGSHAFVILSSSCSSAGLGTAKYSTATVPVVLANGFGVWNNFSDMNGALPGATDNINIINATPLLAGGLATGIHTYSTVGGDPAIYFGGMASGVVQVGDHTNGADYNMLWYVPSGGALQSGNAAGMRIGIHFSGNGHDNLDADGTAIWNGLVDMIEAEIGGGPTTHVNPLTGRGGAAAQPVITE